MKSEPTFLMFGVAHLITVWAIVFVSVGLPAAVRRLGSGSVERTVALALAILLIVHETITIWVHVVIYGPPLAERLPLNLCDLAVVLTAYTLVRRSYSTYEIVYFWGLGGTLQAILTPDLQHGFPHPVYLAFFLGHGLIIVGVMYATLVYRFRPMLRSILKTVIVTIGYMVLVTPINLALDANYLYLRYKPSRPSLIDYLGPWPWYILGLVVVGVISCFVCYAPFGIWDRWSRRKATEKLP